MNTQNNRLMEPFANEGNSIYEAQLRLIRPDNQVFTAHICLGWFPSLPELAEYVQTKELLHPEEQSYAAGLKFEKRRKSYLMGRLTAKRALVSLLGEVEAARLLVEPGIFTQPVVIGAKTNVQVSITHSDHYGAALAFPEAHPMGIDLEEIAVGRNEALERYLTPKEKEQILTWPYTYEEGITLVWTAKEAISKVFKTGLMASLEVFEIVRSEVHQQTILSYYKNFHQYKVLSFRVGRCICSVVYPLKTELDFQLAPLQARFSTLV